MISPWVSFSFHDLLSSRRWIRMGAVQQAIYINLLGIQATSGPLPEDPAELAFLACRATRGLAEEDFAEAWVPPLTECFEPVAGGLANPRMTQEVEVAQARSARGRANARARWSKRNATADATALPPQSHGNASQDRQTDNSPLTPQGGDAVASLDLVSLVTAWWPGSRLARGDASLALSWTNEWAETGCTLGTGALATARYRASGGKDAPTPAKVAEHARVLLRDAEVGLPSLAEVVDGPAPGDLPLLEQLGVEPGSRARDWPPGAATRWTRLAATARLDAEWASHPMNPKTK